MAKKPLHDKLVHHSVHMLDLYQKRITTMEEFIRANITGDEQGFKILAPMVGKGTGTKRPFYDTGFNDGIKTKKAVQQAQEWRTTYEQEEPAAEVPALREGSDPDQAREVPAAPCGAGQDVSNVESEGGAID